MLTLEQRNQFRQFESDLDVVTIDRILTLTNGLEPSDLRQALQDTVPGLVEELGEVSAFYGADSYDLSREQSRARGDYRAFLSDPINRAQVQGALRWIITPEDVGGIANRATDTVPRLVREANRTTVLDNTLKDPDKPQFRRVPAPGACGFCIMLAARGTVYWSENRASTSVGPRRGKKSRASAGGAYHNHCKCRVEQVYPGDAEPEDVSVMLSQWTEATKGFRGMDAIRAFNRKVAAARVAEGGA